MRCYSTIQNAWTALKQASNRGHHKVAEVLLRAGANPNLQDKVSTGQNRILRRCLTFGVHLLPWFWMILLHWKRYLLLIMVQPLKCTLHPYCWVLCRTCSVHYVCQVCISCSTCVCVHALNSLIQYLMLYMYLSWLSRWTFSLTTFCTFPEHWMWTFYVLPTFTYTHTHTQDGFFPLYDASQEGYDGIVVMLLQAGATVDLQSKVEECYCDSTFSSVTCSVPLAMFTATQHSGP